jgi:iron complex outermembrane receptor protein
VVDVTGSVVYRGTDPTYPLPQGVVPNGQPGGVLFGPDGFATRTYDIEYHKMTGTLGVTWQPDDDTTAYFRYGRGYKRGGISAGIASTEGQFPYTGPEYIDAFDAGVKKNFGRTVQANVALFYYPYKDLQAPLTVPNLTGGLAPTQSRFLNVEKSVTQGIEIETVWQPIDHLTILANYSYTDAHVRKSIPVIDSSDPSALDKDAKPILTGAPATCTGSGSTPTATNPNPNPLCDTATGLVQRFQNISGNSLPQTPKHKVAINATYTWTLDDWTVSPSVSYVWRDHQYSNLFERDYNASPSWDQVDARVSVRDKDNHYTVIAFVKNLFDTLGYDGGSSVTRVAGVYPAATVAASNGAVRPGTIATAGTVNGVANTPLTFNGVQGYTKNFALTPPRTYGVEFQYRF